MRVSVPIVVSLALVAACHNDGADPGELRLARKRAASLEQRITRIEEQRIRDACQAAELLLRENAIQRMDLAEQMAGVKQVQQLAHSASHTRKTTAAHHSSAADIGGRLVGNVRGGSKPAFVFFVDVKGRVVARIGVAEETYGDDISGYYSIAEALHGYLRDDVWVLDGRLYRVAVAPIIRRAVGDSYAGAVVVGHAMDTALAKVMAKSLRVHVAFYGDDGVFGRSRSLPGVDRAVHTAMRRLKQDRTQHCLLPTGTAVDNDDAYLFALARLPGEAGLEGATYAVYAERSVRGRRMTRE